MVKKYVVELETVERKELEGMINRGQAAARKILHARILLKADSRAGGPGWKDEQIADAFGVAVRTVELIRKRLVEEGLEEALNRRQRASGISRRKLDERASRRYTVQGSRFTVCLRDISCTLREVSAFTVHR